MTESTASPIISQYRNNYTVETLTRIHNVTGQEFPISGDAPLRMKARLHAQRVLDERAEEIKWGLPC